VRVGVGNKRSVQVVGQGGEKEGAVVAVANVGVRVEVGVVVVEWE